MKKIITALLLLGSLVVNANTGCLISQFQPERIYTNPTGHYPNLTNSDIPNTDRMLYDGTVIYRRNWPEDPNVGLLQNQYTPAYGQHCVISNGMGDYYQGTPVSYNPSDVYTGAVQLPIDDYIPALMVIAGCLVWLWFRKGVKYVS